MEVSVHYFRRLWYVPMEVNPTKSQMWHLICFPPRVTTQKIIYLSHIEYLSPHKQYHPHENPQTIYTIYENPQMTYTIYESPQTYTICENKVIHIVNKHSHIFLIHMTSQPHRLIEVFHFVSDSYTYTTWNWTHTKTYASHEGVGLFKLCSLPSGVSLKIPWANEFPDPPSCSPGAPIVAGGVWYYILIWLTKV
jgi:hypothetical protein